MNASDFETRRNRILETVIEAHVASALPVGSEYVAKRLRPAVSSATIRNVMGELEEAGYLVQPHTSAGRVPTDRGYRFYVDSVMPPRSLPAEQVRQVRELIAPEELEAGHVMARASAALAELAQEAGFVLAPTVKSSKVRQIELVPLGVRRVLCVLVANEEMVASHVVEITEPLTREEVVALSRFINTELVGLPFSDLLGLLERRLLAEQDTIFYLVKRSLTILQGALSTEPTERLFLEGASYVLAQPEFERNPRQAHALVRLLESEDALVDCLRRELPVDGVRVRIGHELPADGLHSCSAVVAPFAVGPGAVGLVGVLGPKRMDYPRVRALVDAVSRSLTDLFQAWERGG